MLLIRWSIILERENNTQHKDEGRERDRERERKGFLSSVGHRSRRPWPIPVLPSPWKRQLSILAGRFVLFIFYLIYGVLNSKFVWYDRFIEYLFWIWTHILHNSPIPFCQIPIGYLFEYMNSHITQFPNLFLSNTYLDTCFEDLSLRLEWS